MLLRRGWRIALLQTAPLARRVRHLVGHEPDGLRDGQLPQPLAGADHQVRVDRCGLGVRAARPASRSRCRARPSWWSSGFVVAIDRDGVREIRGRFAVPLALLVGAVLFLLVTGVVRVGPTRARSDVARHRPGSGPAEPLRVSRRRDGAARRSRSRPTRSRAGGALLTIPIVVLLLAGVPGNVHELRIYTDQGRVLPGADAHRHPRRAAAPARAEDHRAISPAHFNGLVDWLARRQPAVGPDSVARAARSPRRRSRARRSSSWCARRRSPSTERCAPLERTQRRVLRAVPAHHAHDRAPR